MKNKKQLLLLPITIWSGLEQGFFGADFTAVIYLSQVQFLNIWSAKNSFEKKLQSQRYHSRVMSAADGELIKLAM